MTTTVHRPARVRALSPRLDHGVCRGDFPALVFSGARRDLGEVAGEPTCLTPLKYAAVDPRQEAHEDFARSAFMPLPIWPDANVRPIRGVCFVLGDDAHPALERLLAMGGEPGEHFVLVRDLRDSASTERGRALEAFVDEIDAEQPVVLLGYGQQGAAIGAQLVALGVEPGRLVVVDHRDDSVRAAAADGLRVAPSGAAPPGAVIYTPLARHERLAAIARDAAAAGLPVFDNTVGPSGAAFHRRVGRLDIGAAAARAFRVDGTRLAPGEHGLPLDAVVVRDEVRSFGGVHTRWLRSGQTAALRTPGDGVDLAARDPRCPLAAESFVRLERAYVSLRNDPAPAVFAARGFCLEQWPEATEAVFPSRHPCDMGATGFERVLLRHLGRCEIAMASQTSAEQVALGVLARHHAAETPIVEIGSALGGSGVLMAAATGAAGADLVSIDPDTASRDVMRFLFEREGLGHRLKQVIATSDDAAPGLLDLAARAGLVLIDGLHTEEAVRRDLANYAALVRPGGGLLLHDVTPGWYTVMRAAIESLLPDPRFVLAGLVDSLAIFRRR